MTVEEQILSLLRERYNLKIQSTNTNISRIEHFVRTGDNNTLQFYSDWGPTIAILHQEIIKWPS